jgi:DNA polymerase III epsilon subunit-like protein
MSFPRRSYQDLRFSSPLLPNRTGGERLVFVDIETAGAQTWRPIIQIAAIAVNNSFHELEQFEEKILFDHRRAAARCLRKRNYCPKRWAKQGRRDKDVAVDFSAFLTRHATVHAVTTQGRPFAVAQLVAHNASFDAPFLRTWFEQLGLFFPGTYRVFCTLQRALWLFHENQNLPPPRDFKLQTLCAYFGVEFTDGKPHDALADALATVRLYQAMMRRSDDQRACLTSDN